MKKKRLNENYKILHELLRKLDTIISPVNIDSRYKWLTHIDANEELYDEHPQCFVTMNIGRRSVIFPICNRSAMLDPNIIKLSKTFANKMAKRYPENIEEIVVVLKKLRAIERKYHKNRDIPFVSEPTNDYNKAPQVISQIQALLSR